MYKHYKHQSSKRDLTNGIFFLCNKCARPIYRPMTMWFTNIQSGSKNCISELILIHCNVDSISTQTFIIEAKICNGLIEYSTTPRIDITQILNRRDVNRNHPISVCFSSVQSDETKNNLYVLII